MVVQALKVLYGRGSQLYELLPDGKHQFVDIVEGGGEQPFLFVRTFSHYDPRKLHVWLRFVGPFVYLVRGTVFWPADSTGDIPEEGPGPESSSSFSSSHTPAVGLASSTHLRSALSVCFC